MANQQLAAKKSNNKAIINGGNIIRNEISAKIMA